jgi:hypothetical protein
VLQSRSPHSEILAAVGRSHLASLGMQRRGRSRLWLKDNSWWLSLVEFQPSGWGKGSYLNVAAMWLWHPKDHFAFDECARVGGFIQFADAGSFATAASELGELAASETTKNLRRFSSVAQVASHLTTAATGNPWHHYHAMMAALALNDLVAASAQQAALERIDHPASWCVELKTKAQSIVQAASHSIPQDVVYLEVQRARELLKLPSMSSAEVWA